MNEFRNKRAVALGYFDGLHIAHKRVLDAALAQKDRGLTPAVILFDEPPVKVLKGINVPRLMTDEDRDQALREMGFELIKISFNAIKDESPENFVRNTLVKQWNVSFVSCGYNYRFGKNGAGSAQSLLSIAQKEKIDVHISEELCLFGESVSSTRIRKAVENGETALAAALLGHPLYFTAPVFSGDHRGRLLGSPTINQFLPENFVVPKFGVYTSLVEVKGKIHLGVTNVGNRPTFNGQSVRSETYILDFEGDLYGENIRVGLLDFQRPEKKFDSFEALQTQIRKDAENARKAGLPALENNIFLRP